MKARVAKMKKPAPSPAAKPGDVEQMSALIRFTEGHLNTPFFTPFGCSIVRTDDGSLLARQMNHGRQTLDPTAHAEVHTIRAASRKLKSMSLKGHTLYTTCEPCPMCMGAALWAGLDRVVYGATIGDAAKYCTQIYTYSKQMVKKSDLTCEVVGPVERARCVALFEAGPMRRAPARPKPGPRTGT